MPRGDLALFTMVATGVQSHGGTEGAGVGGGAEEGEIGTQFYQNLLPLDTPSRTWPHVNPQETSPPPKLWSQSYWFKYLY